MKYINNLINHYNEEVEYYSDSWLEKWHLDMELKVINRILGKIIQKKHKEGLDIACHTGRYTFLLAEKGLNSLGIDTSDKALSVAEKVKAKSKVNNASFRKMDATKIKISKKFDVIVLMELLHHLPDELAVNLFKKSLSMLNSNGFLIFDLKNILNPVITKVYKKYSNDRLLLKARHLSFFDRIAKERGCKIVLKKSLVTPLWQIEPFVIVVVKK